MSQHLPILQVVIPLLAAPLCVLVRHRVAARLLASLVAWACLAIALSLTGEVLQSGTISY